jgi:hypothetical protein
MLQSTFELFLIEPEMAVAIPVNLHNASHWAAIALRKSADGDFVVFYKDSMGNPMSEDSTPEAWFIIEQIKMFANNMSLSVTVHQLMKTQQYDSTSCGAFTVAYQVALCSLPSNQLNF